MHRSYSREWMRFPLRQSVHQEAYFSGSALEENIGLCTPSIDEYVGEKLIQRSKEGREHYLDYSHVEYDFESRKVLSLNFVMRYGVIDRVKEILEIKYGKAQNESSTPGVSYWYGDKDGNAVILLKEMKPVTLSFLGKPKP